MRRGSKVQGGSSAPEGGDGERPPTKDHLATPTKDRRTRRSNTVQEAQDVDMRDASPIFVLAIVCGRWAMSTQGGLEVGQAPALPPHPGQHAAPAAPLSWTISQAGVRAASNPTRTGMVRQVGNTVEEAAAAARAPPLPPGKAPGYAPPEPMQSAESVHTALPDGSEG